MEKTEQEIINLLNGDIESGNLSKLYDQEYINYSGNPSDNKNILYSDIIAKQLIERLFLFNNGHIEKIERKNYGNGLYIQEDHKRIGNEAKNLPYNTEPQFAKYIYNSELQYLGKIIDFEIPIGDRSLGAVDLLAYNGEILSLVELKGNNSDETMLRAILEICTYDCQINKIQLEKELKENNMCQNIKRIKKAILISETSPLYKHYKETKLVSNLAQKLEIDIFTYTDSAGKVIVKKI